jgi:hypothetical protein
MLGDPSVAFSADRTLVLNGETYTGKLYAVPGRQRHEQQIGGVEQVILLNGGAAQGFLVMPALGTYVEFRFARAVAELSQADLLATKLGEETIEGRRTTKYRIEHTVRDGTLVDGYLWLTREGIPMRLDGTYTAASGGAPTTVHMELSHLREGPQDAALFTVPPNMMKLQLPASALGALMGGAKGG